MDSVENSSRSLERIKKNLGNDPDIQQAILFGSYATGTNTKRSEKNRFNPTLFDKN